MQSKSSAAVMKVSDVMSTDLLTARASEPLNDAVRRMIDRGVGCIVVTDNKDESKAIGIITKGDVLRKAFLANKRKKKKSAKEMSAKDAMTRPIVTIDSEATLEEASKLMSLKHISKLPVLIKPSARLMGIVTATDIIGAEPMQVGYLQELVRARFVPHDLR